MHALIPHKQTLYKINQFIYLLQGILHTVHTMSSDDNDLRRQLKQYGVEVGPITDSTRDLYKRMLQKKLKVPGKMSRPAPSRVVQKTVQIASNRNNAGIPSRNVGNVNSPTGRNVVASLSSPNKPLNTPRDRGNLSGVSSRGAVSGLQHGYKRPAPNDYEAEPKRPRLNVYNSGTDSEEDREISAHPVASSSPKYQRLYPTLPDDIDGEESAIPEQRFQIGKRLSSVSWQKERPSLLHTPPPKQPSSNVSLSPPSPSASLGRREGGGLVSAFTGFIGAGVRNLVKQIASPRQPIRSSRMIPIGSPKNPRPVLNVSGSSSNIGASSSRDSISIGEVNALDLSLPESPPLAPEPPDDSIAQQETTGYDWELQPSDVEICKKANGSLWRLGKGGFGEVFKGLKDSVDEVAVKVIRIQTSSVAIELFKREIDIISKLRHRHILQFYGACIQPNCLYMVTELMQSDLFSNLRRDIRYMWTGIYGKEVLLGVASGLHYLHSRKPPIVHRDIKSPNILLMDGIAKIADVGIARSKSDSDMTAQKGYTIAWAAPEVVYRRRATEKIDIWSFGVIIWEVVSAKLPRVGHLVLPSQAPPPLRALYTMCVDEDPNKRPSAEQIIKKLKAIK